ncbi:hypothetical protein [Chitinophaga sp.]|uniref:hypothetical protein n=1 Tax=Chitinophaga sp. TaxID=1869181 RepID=UPI002F955010
MFKKGLFKSAVLVIIIFTTVPGIVHAQEKPATPAAPSDEELKRANDPMASVKAVNIHNYIVSKLYGLPDQQANQLIVRYSQPIGPVLLRASMPFVTSSASGVGPTSGLGDFNLFAIYTLPTKTGNKFGIGPNLTAPTGTRDLGSGKWQAGLSFLAFFAKSRLIQFGSLLQWQASFAGDEDRPEISTLNPQVFFIWQIGAGFNLRSTGIWTFNLRNGDYNVPIGLGAGKVIKVGGIVFNIFAEPQFTVLAQGLGQPKFQTFVGFNTQF